MRWQSILLIVGILVTGVVASNQLGDASPEVVQTPLAQMLSVGLPPDSSDNAWFCAGQSAGDGTEADGTVTVSNFGEKESSGTITIVSDDRNQDPFVEKISVPGLASRRVRLADLMAADWVSASIEMSGGDIAVEHEVIGPEGKDVAACANHGSASFTWSAGASTIDATTKVAVYNPYSAPVTLDFSFVADGAARDKPELTGFVLDPGQMTVVDVSKAVTDTEVITTKLSTRQGLVVADRIETFNGEGAATTAEEVEAQKFIRHGLTLTPGSASAALDWAFPAGASTESIHEQLVITNDDENEPARIEVSVLLADPKRFDPIDPQPVTVAPGSFSIFDLASVANIPAEITHSLRVTSTNDVPIRVERELVTDQADVRHGVATSTGSPVSSSRWVFASGVDPSSERANLVLLNPGDRDLTVSVTAYGDSKVSPVTALDGREQTVGPRFTIKAGSRLEFRLGELSLDRSSLIVNASLPIVAERRVESIDGGAPVQDEADDSSDEEKSGDSKSKDGQSRPPSTMWTSTTLGLPLLEGLRRLG